MKNSSAEWDHLFQNSASKLSTCQKIEKTATFNYYFELRRPLFLTLWWHDCTSCSSAENLMNRSIPENYLDLYCSFLQRYNTRLQQSETNHMQTQMKIASGKLLSMTDGYN